MPILGAIGIIFQVYFVIHAIKNGKDRFWVYIIIFFPLVGCLVYFFIEVLPDLQTTHRAKSKAKKKRKLSYLKDQVELSPSVKNKKALAEHYLNKGRFNQAIELYQSCLEGVHENDPAIVEGICLAVFFNGDIEKAKSYLINLREIREEFKGDEFDLLFARACEELGEFDLALKEYPEIIKMFSGDEARCRYAMLLHKLGKKDDAKKHFNEIIKKAKYSPKFYKKSQKEWIDIAKNYV